MDTNFQVIPLIFGHIMRLYSQKISSDQKKLLWKKYESTPNMTLLVFSPKKTLPRKSPDNRHSTDCIVLP